MAKFMGKDMPTITMQMKDIVYMPDYHKHACTGKGAYEFVDVAVPMGKQRKHWTLIRCKTCGKVFRTDNPLGNYTAIKPKAKQIESSKQTKKKVRVVKQIPKGERIYCCKPKRHVCSGIPDYRPIGVELFREEGLHNLIHCRTCDSLFYTGDKNDIVEFNSVKGWYYDLYDAKGRIEPPRNNEKPSGLGEKKELPEEVDCIVNPQDFLIVTSVRNCAGRNHALKEVNAKIRALKNNGSIVELITPAFYCESCRQYYMLEQDYERVMKYGAPLCKTITIESFIKMKEGMIQYNDESVLHSLGYNVNAQEDLSDRERHNILSVVIDEGVMSKAEVLSFLDYLIRRSQGSPRLDNARGKWSRDRQYVSQYRRKPARSVDVKSITVRSYRKK